MVAPPRVAQSPAALECKVIEIQQLKDMHGQPVEYMLVIGQVVGVHIDEHFIKEGLVDMAAMRPISRCGYMDYVVSDAVFSLARPA
jgi:flavin reductase (DIM6/NTAB) family NADH-FMN oxidoreductase RutF